MRTAGNYPASAAVALGLASAWQPTVGACAGAEPGRLSSTISHACLSMPDALRLESARPEMMEAELMARILVVITREPGLDDEEIGDRAGITPFEASELLNRMQRDGLVIGR